MDSDLAAPSARLEFARWVEPHLAVMRAVARRWAADDGADVVQETLLRAWRSREKFRESDGTPRAWLLTILTNELRREHRRPRPVPAGPVEAPAVDPDAATRLLVESAVRGLSERQQQAVVLFYFADLSVAEVASVLGIADGTVKAHLSAARERLRILLEER